MVQLNSTSGGHVHTVALDKTGKKSFGISIVRGEIKDSPNTKTNGIFIKGIVPDSPAQLCGKLKVGDRILTINNNDVRNATEQEVILLIKDAGIVINLEIQTFEHEKADKPEKSETKPVENGFAANKNKFQASIKQAPAPKPPNVNSMLKNSNYSSNMSMKKSAANNDDDEDDERDMTGRIRTEAGIEIDRASAGNCKLNNQEKARDKETPDEFGYTMAKINKRYNMVRDVRRVELMRPPNVPMGLALAGHSDRQRMACFIAGIDPEGLLASLDVKPGDEILEVNGTVLRNRCHLNASVVFKNILSERVVLITSRRKPGDEGMGVTPVKKFPPKIDDTKFLLEQFPKSRTVAVKKEGFIGIMIIYGKHVEVGNGIFISDLREGSNAEAAGIKVGDMLLAVNKDVTLESTYDEAVALLKRAEGLVNLLVITLKEEKKEDKPKEEEKPKEPEKIDPATVQVKPNQKMVLEMKIEKKPLGVIVVGGKNNHVKTGCVITHIYPEGAIAADNRVQIFDHVIEVQGKQMDCTSMTTLKVHQVFHTCYENLLTIQVYRADPVEVETIKVDITKKAGKDFGLSLAPNEKGCTISEIVPSGYSEIDNKLQRGDIITKFNGESLEGCTFEICYALFKGATGKISLEVTRPKPTVRTEAAK
ncbi:inactivation-no-after-potential D protein [Stomoxys calcitrans]|uniref:PDZ domain-containing protein n=1 Tax=Stomoxys calcitrans TaxID=35570 RepID=A0A1I8Q139_STOCA|nr:inactivation-no-after-potential D protein [Stomoxys calcitrans]